MNRRETNMTPNRRLYFAVVVLLALGTSSAIGIAFGLFPARKAARLDPVAALGRE